MNKDIVKQIFPEMVDNVEKGKCAICGMPIVQSDFKDALSLKEFEISGMCQKCQDKVFD